MLDLSKLKYIQAASGTYKEVSPGRHVQWIVIHSAESLEVSNAALGIANYFKNGSGGRKASAHFVCDNQNIIHCVQLKDVAYGAPSANRNGVHIEHAGQARQSILEWKDAYSWPMLLLSAQLSGALAAKYDIPMRFLHSGDLKRGKSDTSIKGFTTHLECTKAFYPGGHTDPGKFFPVSEYLSLVIKVKNGLI